MHTWARDVESDTLCPGSVASQRGCPNSGGVVSGGQKGQVDPPKLGISQAGHAQHGGLLRTTSNSWLRKGWRQKLGLGKGAPWGTYLSQAAVFDFILEDESIGVRGFEPAQEDTALAGCLPGHLPWDAIGFSCGRGQQTVRSQVLTFTFMFKPKGVTLGGSRKL